jgi:DNA-binding transcriptional LysR family regulator
MDLELQHLRSFVAVAEELHFGRAALRLDLSQPQVSRHVRALEDALGVTLLTRTSRHAALTAAGTTALADARETLAAAERLRTRAAAARGGAGRVGVAFVWSTLAGYLAPLVAAAGDAEPRIDLAVTQLRFVEVVPALRRGDVDLAITRPLHEPSEMVEHTLRSEPSVVALAAGHPLAARERLTLHEFAALPLIMLRRDLAPRAHDAARAAARRLGLTLEIAREARSPAEALALAGAGFGAYRLPASAASPRPGVVFRELEGARTRAVLLRRPEPPAPAVAAAIALARRVFDAPDASNDDRGGLDTEAGGA